jgi:hypothetical protein
MIPKSSATAKASAIVAMSVVPCGMGGGGSCWEEAGPEKLTRPRLRRAAPDRRGAGRIRHGPWRWSRSCEFADHLGTFHDDSRRVIA